MATKPATLERCRAAYQILTILLDREPSQREVARCAPATTGTVSTIWDEIISDEVDEPQQAQVPAQRRCLACLRMFNSRSAGNRICQRCRGLDSWQAGVTEYQSLQF
jgi:hypothetical protein